MNIVADRLFDVDIFARLHGPHPHQRVPVIRSRTGQDVDSIGIQGLSNIRIHNGFVPLRPGDLVGSFTTDFFVDVDNPPDHGTRIVKESTDVFTAPTVHSGNTNLKLLIGALCPQPVSGAGNKDGRSQGGELATGELIHGVPDSKR